MIVIDRLFNFYGNDPVLLQEQNVESFTALLFRILDQQTEWVILLY